MNIPTEVSGRKVTRRGVHLHPTGFHGYWLERADYWTDLMKSMGMSWCVCLSDSDGAMVPGVMTLGGQVMGGWLQYCFQPTAGLWNGHAAYRHWKVTRDEKFLAQRAYPWLAEVAGTVFSLCEEEDGILE